MNDQIITANKSILSRINKYSKLNLPEMRNSLCPYCNKPIKQMGRMFVCACTGSAIRLTSGKNIKRNQKF